MIVIDTHVLIWAMSNDGRLGRTAARTLEASAATSGIGVSEITAWEIAMLSEKGRLVLGKDVAIWIDTALGQRGVVLLPLDPLIAIDSVRLAGPLHRDPCDRIIIATARFAEAPLMTADRAILDYGARGHLHVVDAGL